MTTFNEKEFRIGTAEYDRDFWDTMRGSLTAVDNIHCGVNKATGAFVLPSGSNEKYEKAIKRESIFRNIATVVKAYGGASRIFAKDCDDLAQWVPEGGSIPIFDSADDFTQHPVDMHKLAAFVKLDDDFIHDAAFNIRTYLTDRLARNFARPRIPGSSPGQAWRCRPESSARIRERRSHSPWTASDLMMLSACSSPLMTSIAERLYG